MSWTREGGCQCGSVRYRISGPPQTLYLCHCKECQKQSANAFGMSLWVLRSDFEIVSGGPKFWQRSTDSGRTMVCAFCADCGSRLYHADNHDSETVSVKAGSLDDTSDLVPIGHIWTRSAQPWVPIDALPGSLRHETEPERFDAYIERWAEQQRAKGTTGP